MRTQRRRHWGDEGRVEGETQEAEKHEAEKPRPPEPTVAFPTSLVWHGTREANFKSIGAKGLLVPGQSGVKVVNGSAYGTGIYTASSPQVPITYTKGDHRLLLCAILDDPAGVKTCGGGGDYKVIKASDFVIPLYEVTLRTTNAQPAPRRPLPVPRASLSASPPPVNAPQRVMRVARQRRAPPSLAGFHGRATNVMVVPPGRTTGCSTAGHHWWLNKISCRLSDVASRISRRQRRNEHVLKQAGGYAEGWCDTTSEGSSVQEKAMNAVKDEYHPHHPHRIVQEVKAKADIKAVRIEARAKRRAERRRTSYWLLIWLLTFG